MKPISKVAILIPAHNEEKVIARTVLAALKLAPSDDVYVVSDGSEDETAQIARQYTPNVLSYFPNKGKANAMNFAISYFKLPNKYELIMPVDADTEVSPNFLEYILPVFAADYKKEIACVVGRVVGRNTSWITSYRLWEYEIGQLIHKSAQSIERAIAVCPGCATVYRAAIFSKYQIPTGTLTEDMDFTYVIHRQNIGRILYMNKSTVTTQDPNNLKDFAKQLDRWYTGFWQCVVKHRIPWKGQMLDLEVAMLALEGLTGGLIVIGLFLTAPIVITQRPELLFAPIGFDIFILMLPTTLYVAWKFKAWNILLFLPHFYFIRLLSSLIFLKSFIKVVLGLDLQMQWNKARRYAAKEAS